MHSLTKLTPLIRKEIYAKYKEKMKLTKGKGKEACYAELAAFYRVHSNITRKGNGSSNRTIRGRTFGELSKGKPKETRFERLHDSSINAQG